MTRGIIDICTFRYLQEFTSLGTAGGIFQFRDQIGVGGLDLLFVMNADVCCDAPLQEMVEFHEKLGCGDKFVILSTEVCFFRPFGLM